ncbi:MAG: extracellular solute-binding protein [Oscillospiraceae bacterium]|nr:extracellular solute-binding protein [Oscillospiraceae bacterium]
MKNSKDIKDIIKYICLFIGVFLILLATACSNKPAANTNNNTENQSQNVNDASETETETTARLQPDLPVKDFGGYKFNIITSDYKADPNMPREIGAEEENGDPINDAVYARNKKIEDEYNVQINEILYARDDMNTPVKKAVLAADGSYDLVCSNIYQAGILSQTGNLLDLNQVNYLELTKPWYDQNASADLSIGHKLFYAVGDLQISNKDGTWAVLFNKHLFQNLGLDDPYTLVKGGTWTMDKFFEFAAAANKDLNGDGVINEEDQVGIEGESFDIYALMNGAGTRLVPKDQDDLPYYAGYTSKDVDIFNKGAAYLGDKTKTILADNYSSKYTDVWDDFINPLFTTDRIMFFFTSLSRVTYLRSSDVDFGILPVPKYDEQQQNYVSTISVWLASGICMPSTLGGDALDRSAIIADALSAESLYTLTPAYYDIQLKTKLTRDNESSEMLDIIFANRTYSLLQIYDWGGMLSTINGLLTKTSPDFVSSMDKIENKVNSDIAKTIKAYGD